MNDTNIAPWLHDAKELIEFALNTLRTPAEINQRISFLLLDLGVEILFKTFLSLPDETSGANLCFAERRKCVSGHFPDLIQGVSLAARGRISETDLHSIKFYHGIRNQLYHQGRGLTVRQEHVNQYARVATTLLKQLLDIDLTDLVEEPFDQEDSIYKERALSISKEMSQNVDRFKGLVKLVIENFEPKLIYPSVVAKLKEIALEIGVLSFSTKVREFRALVSNNITDPVRRSWLLEFITDDISFPQAISNTQFVMELGKDPVSFYSLLIGLFLLPIGDVRRDTLHWSEDISFLDSDEYHIMGVYNASSTLLEMFLNRQEYVKEDAGALERSEEVLKKLKIAIKRLEGVITV